MLVIDSTILLLYFAGEKRAEKIINDINDELEEGCIFEVSILTLLDKMIDVLGYSDAIRRLEAIKNSKIKLVGLDLDIAKNAMEIKRVHNIPLLGAYLIALAKSLNATLVTTNHRLKADDVKVEYIEPVLHAE